jgi:hypothetical protein
MIHQELRLSSEQVLKLVRLADEERVSVDEMIRRWVVRALEEAPGSRERYARAAKLVGAFADLESATDLSVDHDRYLQESNG